jgi:hypothetical protein
MAILKDYCLLRCDILCSGRQVVKLRLEAGSYSETSIHTYIYMYTCETTRYIITLNLNHCTQGREKYKFWTYKSSTATCI